MANLYNSVKSCLYKGPSSQQVEIITDVNDIKEPEVSPVSESSSFSSYSNKKTDEIIDPSKQPGILWRVSSGVYSTATGAVGAGIGGVCWVAGKTYDVGSAVVGKTYDVGSAVTSKVPMPGLPFGKKKDKNE